MTTIASIKADILSALTEDSIFVNFCLDTFSTRPSLYDDYDEENPPASSSYPIIVLFSVNKVSAQAPGTELFNAYLGVGVHDVSGPVVDAEKRLTTMPGRATCEDFVEAILNALYRKFKGVTTVDVLGQEQSSFGEFFMDALQVSIKLPVNRRSPIRI